YRQRYPATVRLQPRLALRIGHCLPGHGDCDDRPVAFRAPDRRGREGDHFVKRLSPPLWLSAGVLYLFLYAPIAVLVSYSFNAAQHGGPWRGFTTQWYGSLFNSPEKLSAVENTLILATTSTAISTVLGTMLGYGLSRYLFPGKQLFSWLMYIPVVIPD